MSIRKVISYYGKHPHSDSLLTFFSIQGFIEGHNIQNTSVFTVRLDEAFSNLI